MLLPDYPMVLPTVVEHGLEWTAKSERKDGWGCRSGY